MKLLAAAGGCALQNLRARQEPDAEKAARVAFEGAHGHREAKPFLPVVCLQHPLLPSLSGSWQEKSKGLQSIQRTGGTGEFGAEGH